MYSGHFNTFQQSSDSCSLQGTFLYRTTPTEVAKVAKSLMTTPRAAKQASEHIFHGRFKLQVRQERGGSAQGCRQAALLLMLVETAGMS